MNRDKGVAREEERTGVFLMRSSTCCSQKRHKICPDSLRNDKKYKNLPIKKLFSYKLMR